MFRAMWPSVESCLQVAQSRPFRSTPLLGQCPPEFARSQAGARQDRSAEALQKRLDENPHAMRTRRETAEHPFGNHEDAHGRNSLPDPASLSQDALAPPRRAGAKLPRHAPVPRRPSSFRLMSAALTLGPYRDREAPRYGKMLLRRFSNELFTVASGGCLEEASALKTYRHAVVDADQ
jgi:hypothetical protein